MEKENNWELTSIDTLLKWSYVNTTVLTYGKSTLTEQYLNYYPNNQRSWKESIFFSLRELVKLWVTKKTKETKEILD